MDENNNWQDNRTLLDIVTMAELEDRDELGRVKLGRRALRNFKKQKRKEKRAQEQGGGFFSGVLTVCVWGVTVALVIGNIASAMGLYSLKYGVFAHFIMIIVSLSIKNKSGSRACEICALVNVMSACGILYGVLKGTGLWDNVKMDIMHI